MTRPFFAADPACWPAIANALPRPWPIEAIYTDLAYWQDRERLGVKRPGRPALAQRWGVTDWTAKAALRDEDRWGDGFKSAASVPPADRQPAASEPPADERSNAGTDEVSASVPPADRQPTTSEPPRARNTTQSHRPQATEEESSARPPTAPAPEHDTTPEAEAVARLHAAWQAHDAEFPICDPRPIFGMLRHAPGDTADEREAVVGRVLDFIATAPADRKHPWGDAPDFLRRQGAGALRVALDLGNRRERWSSLVSWSATWERMGRPARAGINQPSSGRAATSSTPVWDSMREAIERLPYRSIFGERTQAGVMLHQDPAEHARRALAFRRAGDREGYLATLEVFGDAAREAATARFAASFERHYAELVAGVAA